MKRNYLLTCLLLLLLLAGCGQSPEPARPALSPQFGYGGDDTATVVATDATRGRVYIAGTYATNTANPSIFFRRYDRAGRFIWERRANNVGQATDAIVDADGNAYFAWNSGGKGFVSKYSPGGTRVWQLVLRGLEVNGVTVDKSGGVYVGGDTGVYGPFVRKYSDAGKLLWEKKIRISRDPNGEGPPLVGVGDLVVASNGSLYLAGEGVDDTGFVVRLRTSDGAILQSIDVLGSSVGIAASSDSHVYVLTQYEDVYPSGIDSVVFRFGPDLTLTWGQPDLIESTDELTDDDAYGLDVDAAGNVYVTGVYTTDGTGDQDRFVRKYAPSANLLFDRRFSFPSSTTGYAVAVLGASEFYAVGSTSGKVNGANAGGLDAYLAKFNSQGSELWIR